MCHEPKPRDNELTRNLVSLWTHQNTLLWSRTTAITAVQSAVIAGEITWFKSPTYGNAATCALGGMALSLLMGLLVECDLAWKRELGQKLREADDRLLPEIKDRVRGFILMRTIVWGFLILDSGFFVLATMISRTPGAG